MANERVTCYYILSFRPAGTAGGAKWPKRTVHELGAVYCTTNEKDWRRVLAMDAADGPGAPNMALSVTGDDEYHLHYGGSIDPDIAAGSLLMDHHTATGLVALLAGLLRSAGRADTARQ